MPESIKKISGEILLYFYAQQRKSVVGLRDHILEFSYVQGDGNNLRLQARSETILNIDKFKDYTDNDLFLAIDYLDKKGFLEFQTAQDTGGYYLHDIQLGLGGIDIVEGIERSPEEVRIFNITFNFNIENKVTVESLLKTEFGSIFKISFL